MFARMLTQEVQTPVSDWLDTIDPDIRELAVSSLAAVADLAERKGVALPPILRELADIGRGAILSGDVGGGALRAAGLLFGYLQAELGPALAYAVDVAQVLDKRTDQSSPAILDTRTEPASTDGAP